MSCKMFTGQMAYYKPVRIVCGDFQSDILNSQVLWFAIKVVNPSIPNSWRRVSIPFFIYSVEQGTTYRTNFDVIENAVHLRADFATKTDVANPDSANAQLQT